MQRPRRQLSRLEHRGEGRRHALHLILTRVEGHDVGAAARRFEGVAPESAAQVQDPIPGAQAESVVARGEHQSKVIDAGRGRWARMAS